jgi:hypothetical protein
LAKGRLRNTIAVSVLFLLLTCLMLGASGVGAQTAEPEPAVVGDTLGVSGSIGAVIAETPLGTGKGEIDPDAPKGYAGIPGAPQINLFVAFFWSIWVGWIFSTVGAFGGLMAGVGHMAIFGLGPYAKTFKETNPQLNKALTDSIRVSNQFLVGLAAAISSTNYLKAQRLAWPVGLLLALGAISGSVLIPWLTGGKISLAAYQGFFGLFVLLVGGFLLYETTPRGLAGRKASTEAARAFEKHVKEEKERKTEGKAADDGGLGIKVTKWSVRRIHFTWYGVEFSFNPVLPVLGGIVIAAIASFLGVGGGFLYVPFLTTFVGLPMFVVAGTSALTVLIGMVVSITTYMTVAGATVWWSYIGLAMTGIFVGAMIGPRTQKYIPDIWLKRLFIALACYVGFRFIGRGFGLEWLQWIP